MRHNLFSNTQLSKSMLYHFNQYSLYLKIEKGHRPRTVASKLSSLKAFCKKANIHDLSILNSPFIEQRLYEQALEASWSKNTFRNYWKYLRCFCNWALLKGHLTLPENPMNRIDKPKAHKVSPRRLAKHELDSIFTACSTYPWRYSIERARNIAILSMFLFTGIRNHELRGIRTSDISLTHRTLIIREGKGGKSRVLKIPRELNRFLLSYEDHVKRLGIKREFFFCSVGQNTQLTGKYIYNMCRKLVNHTNIYFRPHMLRHTYASLCAENNIPLLTIKESLGHTSLLHTQGYIAATQEIVLSHMDSLPFILGC